MNPISDHTSLAPAACTSKESKNKKSTPFFSGHITHIITPLLNHKHSKHAISFAQAEKIHGEPLSRPGDAPESKWKWMSTPESKLMARVDPLQVLQVHSTQALRAKSPVKILKLRKDLFKSLDPSAVTLAESATPIFKRETRTEAKVNSSAFPLSSSFRFSHPDPVSHSRPDPFHPSYPDPSCSLIH
jgi:hypothetical protein